MIKRIDTNAHEICLLLAGQFLLSFLPLLIPCTQKIHSDTSTVSDVFKAHESCSAT